MNYSKQYSYFETVHTSDAANTGGGQGHHSPSASLHTGASDDPARSACGLRRWQFFYVAPSTDASLARQRVDARNNSVDVSKQKQIQSHDPPSVSKFQTQINNIHLLT